MYLIFNLLWIVVGGGIIAFFAYLLLGVVLCLTIIGIPLGVQMIKLSMLSLTPFGSEVKASKYSMSFSATGLNIIWIILCGLYISILHLLLGVIMAITIIGLPFAFQHFKLASMALTPVGKYSR